MAEPSLAASAVVHAADQLQVSEQLSAGQARG